MERNGRPGCVPYAVIHNSNRPDEVYFWFMTDLGTHRIVHFPAGEYMALNFRNSHFVMDSATSRSVKKV